MAATAWLVTAVPPIPVFPDQVSTNSLTQNVVYASGTVGAILVLAGIVLVDLGGVRRVNVFDSLLQKFVGFFIGFAVYFLIGFAIWNWQYYVAFEVPNPYLQSIADWWLGGSYAGGLAQNVDPEVGTGAALNNQQIFVFFLACFAGIINVLVHLGVTERIRAGAYFVISAVLAVVSSVLSWLTWGSTGPLTSLGYHDFFGSGFVYVFAGTVGLVLAARLRPRPGVFSPHPQVPEYRYHNLGLAVLGLVVIFAGLPMVILSCGFFVAPEALFVSINMSDTSVGIAFNNLGLSWAGGALTGALIAYRTRKYLYALLGPLAGYLAGAPAFDVYAPWQMFLVALVAPLVSYVVYEWMQRREIDEHKLGPVLVGAGSYGIVMVGFVSWGTPQGGYVGIDAGPYAFQNVQVTPWWQIIGLGVVIATGIVTALLLAVVLERTIGLRIPEEEQVRGSDPTAWDLHHDEPVGPGREAGPGPRHESQS